MREHRLVHFQEGVAGSIGNRESLDAGNKTQRELESLQKAIEGGDAYRTAFRSWIQEQLGQTIPAGHRFDIRCEEDFRDQNRVGNLRVVLVYAVGDQEPQTFNLDPTNPEAGGVVVDNESADFPYRSVPQADGRSLLIFTSGGFRQALNSQLTAPNDTALKNWIADLRLTLETQQKQAQNASEGSRGAQSVGSRKNRSEGSRNSRSTGSRGRRWGNVPGSIQDRGGRSRGSRGGR